MATIKLPPDANDLTVSLTFDKTVAPYVKKWYNEKKKAGESVSDFGGKFILRDALVYLAQEEIKKIIAAKQTETQAEKLLIENDVKDIDPNIGT